MNPVVEAEKISLAERHQKVETTVVIDNQVVEDLKKEKENLLESLSKTQEVVARNKSQRMLIF